MIHNKSLSFLALFLVACAPTPSPILPSNQPESTAVAHQRGTDVRVATRIVDPPVMPFQTLLAAGQTRLDHYVMTLKQGAATVSGPTNSAGGSLTFGNVAVGNGYTVQVDAVDANGDAVLTGSGTSASFDVANGHVYATTDVGRTTPLASVTVAITFLDQNIGPTVRVTGNTVGTNSAGISFLNRLNWKSVALEKAVGTDPTDFAITAVQAGATSGTSHSLYTYFVDTALGRATVAKAQSITGTAAGDVRTNANWSPILKPYSMVQAASTTGFSETTGARWVGTDTAAVHFNSGFGIFRNQSGGGYPSGNGNTYSNVGAYTADKDGTVFFFDTGDTIVHKVVANGASPAITGTLTGPLNKLTVDAAGSFYWLDAGGAAKKLPAAAFKTGGGGSDDGVVVTIDAGPYTELAVDAYGNAYLGTNTAVAKAAFNGATYAAPTAWATGAAITYLIADPAGNVYFLDGATTGNLKMRPAGKNTVYAVNGTAAIQVARPAIAANGTVTFVYTTNAVASL